MILSASTPILSCVPFWYVLTPGLWQQAVLQCHIFNHVLHLALKSVSCQRNCNVSYKACVWQQHECEQSQSFLHYKACIESLESFFSFSYSQVNIWNVLKKTLWYGYYLHFEMKERTVFIFKNPNKTETGHRYCVHFSWDGREVERQDTFLWRDDFGSFYLAQAIHSKCPILLPDLHDSKVSWSLDCYEWSVEVSAFKPFIHHWVKTVTPTRPQFY